MKYYILHTAEINNDGELSIDCKGIFSLLSEAKAKQQELLREFERLYKEDHADIVAEDCGTFCRLSITDKLAEIQTHIYESEGVSSRPDL